MEIDSNAAASSATTQLDDVAMLPNTIDDANTAMSRNPSTLSITPHVFDNLI